MINIPLWLNLVIQILGFAVQVFGTPELIPHPLLLRWLLAGGAFIQGVTGILAHFSNPDATSAKTAWVKRVGVFFLALAMVLWLVSPGWATNGDRFGILYNGDFGAKLLDAQTAVDNGVWVDTSSWKSVSYCFSGLESGGSVTLQILNDPATPANTTDGFIIATLTSVSNQCGVLSAYPARWTKGEKAAAGGTPTATTLYVWGLSR